MAADMQRKRSSECPDGTLAPSDGQSVERAESPTPGLAQGMEPGTGRASGPKQLTARAASRAVRLPKHSFPATHSCMCSATRWVFVGHWGHCREPVSSASGLPLHFPLPMLSGCQCGLSYSCVYSIPAWLLLPLSAYMAPHKLACSDHALYRTLVIL